MFRFGNLACILTALSALLAEGCKQTPASESAVLEAQRRGSSFNFGNWEVAHDSPESHCMSDVNVPGGGGWTQTIKVLEANTTLSLTVSQSCGQVDSSFADRFAVVSISRDGTMLAGGLLGDTVPAGGLVLRLEASPGTYVLSAAADPKASKPGDYVIAGGIQIVTDKTIVLGP